MAEIPQWHVAGDWFDVCSCDIACPCIFGQPPTNNVCHGVLAYRIREGYFGDVTLADLKLVLVISFEGNLWASQATDFKVGLFVDSSANSRQQGNSIDYRGRSATVETVQELERRGIGSGH